jgi:hypothetical protein
MRIVVMAEVDLDHGTLSDFARAAGKTLAHVSAEAETQITERVRAALRSDAVRRIEVRTLHESARTASPRAERLGAGRQADVVSSGC